jgi:predicted RNase H-like HicB family nuclease
MEQLIVAFALLVVFGTAGLIAVWVERRQAARRRVPPNLDKPVNADDYAPLVELEFDGRWWAASMPCFPGVYGQGRTRAAAIQSLVSAVRDVVETYRELSRGAYSNSAPTAASR